MTTNQPIPLKACPFCGVKHQTLSRWGETYRRMEFGCPECGARVEIRKTTPYGIDAPTEAEIAEATKIWNTRPLEDAKRQEIAALRNMLTAAGEEATRQIAALQAEMEMMRAVMQEIHRNGFNPKSLAGKAFLAIVAGKALKEVPRG